MSGKIELTLDVPRLQQIELARISAKGELLLELGKMWDRNSESTDEIDRAARPTTAVRRALIQGRRDVLSELDEWMRTVDEQLAQEAELQQRPLDDLP